MAVQRQLADVVAATLAWVGNGLITLNRAIVASGKLRAPLTA
jgi:hypothetical protein